MTREDPGCTDQHQVGDAVRRHRGQFSSDPSPESHPDDRDRHRADPIDPHADEDGQITDVAGPFGAIRETEARKIRNNHLVLPR